MNASNHALRPQGRSNKCNVTVIQILVTHVDRDSYLMTDEAGQYVAVGREFSGHGSVNHSAKEYVRGGFWHTNTMENYFSIMKRGINGVYHHVSQQHLKRYLAKYDFRYNERAKLGVDDAERFSRAIPGIVGKRLTYRRTYQQSHIYAATDSQTVSRPASIHPQPTKGGLRWLT